MPKNKKGKKAKNGKGSDSYSLTQLSSSEDSKQSDNSDPISLFVSGKSDDIPFAQPDNYLDIGMSIKRKESNNNSPIQPSPPPLQTYGTANYNNPTQQPSQFSFTYPSSSEDSKQSDNSDPISLFVSGKSDDIPFAQPDNYLDIGMSIKRKEPNNNFQNNNWSPLQPPPPPSTNRGKGTNRILENISTHNEIDWVKDISWDEIEQPASSNSYQNNNQLPRQSPSTTQTGANNLGKQLNEIYNNPIQQSPPLPPSNSSQTNNRSLLQPPPPLPNNSSQNNNQPRQFPPPLPSNSSQNNNRSPLQPPPPQQAETSNREKQLHETYNIKTDNTIISLEDYPNISEDENTSDIDDKDEIIKHYSPSVNPHPHKYGQFGRIKYTSYPVSDLNQVNKPKFPDINDCPDIPKDNKGADSNPRVLKIQGLPNSNPSALKIQGLPKANSELHSTKAQIIYTLKKNGKTKMRAYDITPNGIARGEYWSKLYETPNITNPKYEKGGTNQLRVHSEPAILRPILRLNAKKINKWKKKGYTNINTKIRLFNSKNAPCDYNYDCDRRSHDTKYKDYNVYCDTLCQKITQEYPDTSIDVHYPKHYGRHYPIPKKEE